MNQLALQFPHHYYYTHAIVKALWQLFCKGFWWIIAIIFFGAILSYSLLLGYGGLLIILECWKEILKEIFVGALLWVVLIGVGGTLYEFRAHKKSISKKWIDPVLIPLDYEKRMELLRDLKYFEDSVRNRMLLCASAAGAILGVILLFHKHL